MATCGSTIGQRIGHRAPAAKQTERPPLKQAKHVDQSGDRLPVLDGWRGISILLVLVGHMLPLGPKWLKLNSMVSASGLSIFFFLSGFLVVSMLIKNGNVMSFFIRRFFRILPLAWPFLILLLVVQGAPISRWLSNLLFYANLVPTELLPHGDHLWSLSVEVQFYIAVGLVVAVLGRRGLMLVPVACIAVTILRVTYGMGFSIATWFRVDEILAGGAVALFVTSSKFATVGRKWPAVTPYVLMLALLISSHESFRVADYLRPYVAALLVYSTMYRNSDRLQEVLAGRTLRYLAKVSYALYVIHPITYSGWLGEGSSVIKYAKRPLSFVLTFLFAHLSSFYYERPWNQLGHRLASSVEKSRMEKSPLQPRSLADG